MDIRLGDSNSTTARVAADIVVFDAPGVLYDDSIWDRWLFRLLQKLGLQADFRIFFRVWEEEFVGEIAAGRVDYWDAFRRYLQELGLRSGCIEEVIVAARSRRHALQQPTCPLNGVQQTVIELFGRGLQLAAIGDRCDAARLGDLLSDWGLQRYFSFVEDPATPAEQVCRQLVQAYGATAQLVVISNSPWMLRQASEAGLRTLAFDATRHPVIACESDIRKLGRSLVSTSTRRLAG